MLLMSLLFTMFATVGHAAGTPPKLYLNGNQLVSDVDPQIENGSTLVPLAILSDGLGYKVEWEPVLKKVTVKKESTIIELVIGEAMIKVNDVIMETATEPKLINQRTMVPVRLVGELLGLQFEWKGAEREVHMYSKTEPAEPEQPQTPGYITNVTMSEQSVITITHSGGQKPGKPMLLDNPKRMVFDLKNTSFIPGISDLFVKGETTVAVMDNALLSGYRYGQFSLDPLVARLVIMVSEDTTYVLTESENAFQIALMPSSEVPKDPETPDDSMTPDEPEKPIEPVDSVALPGETEEVYDIVIDAGHGAKDPGAYSKLMNRWEKEFNLSASLKLKAALEKDKRFRVHMTRLDDSFLELSDRVKFAEERKADIFISIHANSYDKTSVNGSETYYYRENSKPLADHLHKYLIAGTGLNNRGIKKAAFKVIKETTMPAVLIEAGYLSNQTDASALFKESMQDKLADELAKGIKAYLKLK